MDEYEFQQALESLAGAAALPGADIDSSQQETIDDVAERWQRLFGLDHDDAIDRILQHRNDLARMTVNDEHWSTVQHDREAAGYDREAYEYELNLERKKTSLVSTLPTEDKDESITFLVELKGPLSSIESVRVAAALDKVPEVVIGRSAETWETVRLCCIDSKAKANIYQWCNTSGQGYEPTILVNPKSLQ